MSSSFLITDILNLPTQLALESKEEPRLRICEEEPCISGRRLVQFSALHMNQLCQGLPNGAVKEMKKRRRTLKNRVYATNYRQCRLREKLCLELQVKNLQQEVIRLKKELDLYKNRSHRTDLVHPK